MALHEAVDSDVDAPYTRRVLFRDRLLATIAAARAVGALLRELEREDAA